MFDVVAIKGSGRRVVSSSEEITLTIRRRGGVLARNGRAEMVSTSKLTSRKSIGSAWHGTCNHARSAEMRNQVVKALGPSSSKIVEWLSAESAVSA